MAPQFRKRAPGRSDPVTREELQRKAASLARVFRHNAYSTQPAVIPNPEEDWLAI